MFIAGIISGLVLPPISLVLILSAKPEYQAIQKINPEFMLNLNFQIMSMGMLANGLLFFLALRLDKEELGRGILSASVLWLLLFIFVKFIFNP